MVDFMNRKMWYAIGIDPGTHTGVAVYDVAKQRLTEVFTTDFWGAIEFVFTFPVEWVRVYIEVPLTTHVWQKKPANIKAAQRQGVNVGFVIKEAKLLASGLERESYEVVRLHPKGKVDAKRFNAYTGWTKPTNPHERDAALLCYNRS